MKERRNDADMVVGPNGEMTTLLNKADELYRLLQHEKQVQGFVPVFVVLGMQSSGKSSTLRRLCGVEFPVASDQCTRTRIQLTLRRDPSQETRLVKVFTVREKNEREEVLEPDSVQAKIEAAQNSLVEGPGISVNTRDLVQVEVTGSDLPNVTFIDLPGIFGGLDDAEEEVGGEVKAMAEREIKKEGAIVLHVCMVDHDIRQTTTWKMIRDANAADRSLTVFTHADRVETPSQVTNAVRALTERGVPPKKIFVVNAHATGPEEEGESLQRLAGSGTGTAYNLGCETLKREVEVYMADHVQGLLGTLRSEVRKLRGVVTSELDKIGHHHREPAEILAVLTSTLLTNIFAMDPAKERKIGELTETLGQQLAELEAYPVHITQENESRGFKSLLDDANRYLCDTRGERSKGMEDRYGYVAKHMRSFVKQCRPFIEEFIEKLSELVKNHVKDILQQHRAHYRDWVLKIDQEFEQIFEQQKSAVESIVCDQLSALAPPPDLPWTVTTNNDHYLQDSIGKIAERHLPNVSDEENHILEAVVLALAMRKVKAKSLADSLQDIIRFKLKLQSLQRLKDIVTRIAAQPSLVEERADFRLSRENLINRLQSLNAACEITSTTN